MHYQLLISRRGQNISEGQVGSVVSRLLCSLPFSFPLPAKQACVSLPTVHILGKLRFRTRRAPEPTIPNMAGSAQFPFLSLGWHIFYPPLLLGCTLYLGSHHLPPSFPMLVFWFSWLIPSPLFYIFSWWTAWTQSLVCPNLESSLITFWKCFRVPFYMAEAEKPKTKIFRIPCNWDARYELDPTYQMHLDEIWKTEASHLGQGGHGNIKLFYHTVPVHTPASWVRIVIHREMASRFHHQLVEEPFTNGSDGSRGSCLISRLQSCQYLLESIVLVDTSEAIQVL